MCSSASLKGDDSGRPTRSEGLTRVEIAPGSSTKAIVLRGDEPAYSRQMAVTLHVSLWPRPDREEALVAYEDLVLPLLASHGAFVLQRVRTDGSGGAPLEIHLLRFPSEDSFQAYMQDERRSLLVEPGDEAIERTEIVRVEVVE